MPLAVHVPECVVCLLFESVHIWYWWFSREHFMPIYDLEVLKMPVTYHCLCNKWIGLWLPSVWKPEIIPPPSQLYSSSAWSPLKADQSCCFSSLSVIHSVPQVSHSILYSHRCTQEAMTDKVRDRGEACGWKRRITICKERRCQGLSFCLWIKQVGYKGTG